MDLDPIRADRGLLEPLTDCRPAGASRRREIKTWLMRHAHGRVTFSDPAIAHFVVEKKPRNAGKRSQPLALWAAEAMKYAG